MKINENNHEDNSTGMNIGPDGKLRDAEGNLMAGDTPNLTDEEQKVVKCFDAMSQELEEFISKWDAIVPGGISRTIVVTSKEFPNGMAAIVNCGGDPRGIAQMFEDKIMNTALGETLRQRAISRMLDGMFKRGKK